MRNLLFDVRQYPDLSWRWFGFRLASSDPCIVAGESWPTRELALQALHRFLGKR